MAQAAEKVPRSGEMRQRAVNRDHGVWASVLHDVKATVAEWNRKFPPSDGRRIVIEKSAARTFRLRNRSARLIASRSPDGTEILLTEKSVLDVAIECRDSIQIRLNDLGQVVLWHGGSKTTPGEVAYRIVQKLGSRRAELVHRTNTRTMLR